MSVHGFKDGEYGDLTMEAAYLFDKHPDFVKGYHLGKSIRALVDPENDRYAHGKGFLFQQGYHAGRHVRLRGVKVLKPEPRAAHSGSYRDPDLSQRWLKEAEWKARDSAFRWHKDYQKIILRLILEVKRLRGWK